MYSLHSYYINSMAACEVLLSRLGVISDRHMGGVGVAYRTTRGDRRSPFAVLVRLRVPVCVWVVTPPQFGRRNRSMVNLPSAVARPLGAGMNRERSAVFTAVRLPVGVLPHKWSKEPKECVAWQWACWGLRAGLTRCRCCWLQLR